MEETIYYLCPQCGEQKMQQKEGQNLICLNCGEQTEVQSYAMMLQLLEKDILIQALKQFMEKGVGKCIEYNDKAYVIGFDQDYELVCQPYQLGQDEQVGMYVRIARQFQEDQIQTEQQ